MGTLLSHGMRAGLAGALHQVFVAGLPFLGLALLAALFIREVPLRRAVHAQPAGRRAEVDVSPSSTGAPAP
jgi:hypothetical protein